MDSIIEEDSGKRVCQTVVITLLALPQNKPPIEQIVSLSGTMDKELKLRFFPEGKMSVAGNLLFSTMYKEENNLSEDRIQLIEHEIFFDYLFSLTGLQQGMPPQVFAEIEYLNYELVDSNTIELELIFQITAKA